MLLYLCGRWYIKKDVVQQINCIVINYKKGVGQLINLIVVNYKNIYYHKIAAYVFKF